MTDWKRVQGSQPERPEEFDTESSAVVVYQRRNVERITVQNADGTTTELWQYDEREMSHDEYDKIVIKLAVAKNRADIDYIAMSADIELEED